MIILHLSFNTFLYCFGVKMQEIVIIHKGDLVIVHYSPRLFLPYDEKFENFNVFKFLYSLILERHSTNIFKSKFKALGTSLHFSIFFCPNNYFQRKKEKKKKSFFLDHDEDLKI
jgi:hypothetical protein